MPVKKTTSDPVKQMLQRSGAAFLSIATIFLILVMICAVVLMATGRSAMRGQKTITVSGSGTAYAVPDIATLSLSLRNEAEDVATAQSEVTKQSERIVAALAGADIDEADIKTTNYSANPRYEYQREMVACPAGFDCEPGDSKRVLVGYEVSQTLQVKVRDIERVGEVLGLVGGLNVENIYGPNFMVEDEDAAQEDARSEAIEDAQTKAKRLADELGVRLGKVVDFNEGAYGGPVPMMAMSASYDMAEESMARESSPVIPAGENEIRSNVNITYRIK